jgi:hypothetical protein
MRDPCALPLVALRADETCPRCGHPAGRHRAHPSYQEETMEETTEPTREWIEKCIRELDSALVGAKNAAFVSDMRRDLGAYRMALRTMDAEVQLAAMADRAEKAERELASVDAMLHVGGAGAAFREEMIRSVRARLETSERDRDEARAKLAEAERLHESERQVGECENASHAFAIRELQIERSISHERRMESHQLGVNLHLARIERDDARTEFAAMTERAEKAERERDSCMQVEACTKAFHDLAVKERDYERVRVDRLERELAASNAKLAEAERERDEEHRERMSDANVSAFRYAMICEEATNCHRLIAVASLCELLRYDAAGRDRDEARAKIAEMHRRAQRAERATAAARREAIGQRRRADWWRSEAKRLGWAPCYPDLREAQPSPERVDCEVKPSLDDLIEASRSVVMTPEQREAQRRSFAFGNVAIDSPGVTRAHVDAAAERIDALPSFRKAFSDLLTQYGITYLSVEVVRWDPAARQGWLRGMRVDTNAEGWVFAHADDVGVFAADCVRLNLAEHETTTAESK